MIATSVLLLAGCAASPATDTGSRPLSTSEAQLLAIARFNNFDAGTRAVSITVAGSEAIAVQGWTDFTEHEGYGSASDAASGADLGLLAWSQTAIAARDGAVPDQLSPAPADGWLAGALDPASSTLHNVLLVSLSLGNDRPDNPLLLQQTDARWLRSDEISGTPVMVVAGPSSDQVATAAPIEGRELTRYWVDATGHLLRFEVRQSGSTDEWSIVDFGESATVDLTPLAGIIGGGS